MLERIRSERLAPWVVACGVLILILLLGAIVFFTRSEREQMYQEYATSKAYAEAQDRFEEECASFSAVEEARQCFERIIKSTREPQRAEEDLRAQKEMAEWAWWMILVTGLIGVVSVWVAVVGIYWIKQTFDLQRKATDESVRVAQAALEANQLQEKSLALQHRAWLKIVRVELASALSWSDNGKQIGNLRVQFVVENIDSTPALSVQMLAALQSVDNITQARTEAADLLQRMRAVHQWSDRITLFPGDKTDPPQSWICSLPAEDIMFTHEVKRYDTSNKNWYKNILLAPSLVVCVDYKLSFSDEYHQTWEVFSVRKKTSKGVHSRG